jgi:hypothetical protein
MKKNNFQRLEDEIIHKYGEPRETIFNSIRQNLEIFRFSGDIIDLFFPKVFQTLVKMSGGSSRKFISHNQINTENKPSLRAKYPNLPLSDPRNQTKPDV